MRPVIDYWLDEIIQLPEYEAVPEDDVEAVHYLAQWDYGEYSADPITLSDLYDLHGRISMQNGYILFRSYCGSCALYRRGNRILTNDQ